MLSLFHTLLGCTFNITLITLLSVVLGPILPCFSYFILCYPVPLILLWLHYCDLIWGLLCHSFHISYFGTLYLQYYCDDTTVGWFGAYSAMLFIFHTLLPCTLNFTVNTLLWFDLRPILPYFSYFILCYPVPLILLWLHHWELIWGPFCHAFHISYFAPLYP